MKYIFMRLGSSLALVALLVLLVGCSAPDTIFLVMSDIHGYYDHVEEILDHVARAGVRIDGIIITGDLAEHSREKPHNMSDYEEIRTTLAILSKTGLPIYVIPGNHDMREDYTRALRTVNSSHITDMATERRIELEDLIIVSNPYGTDFTYSDEGYKGSKEDIVSAEQYFTVGKPMLLITHQPPKSLGKGCIDQVRTGEHVGDSTLNSIVRNNKIPFVISGHIHEAGGIACTNNGERIAPGEFVEHMRFNPGSVMPWTYLDGEQRSWSAGIITVREEKAAYKMLK